MYNQPFSQPPGMFGAQSAMAQMQSAPSLPAGNPSAREYFNYSMATLSNAAMPRAMMPQGISSLVPQYQFGGDVGFDPGTSYGQVILMLQMEALIPALVTAIPALIPAQATAQVTLLHKMRSLPMPRWRKPR
jgi:hypothetical protein